MYGPLAVVLLSLAALPLAAEGPAVPTKGPQAREVAAWVQSFYDQTKDVSASFYQTYVHKLYRRTDRSKGQVVFKKPGKMRWDYARPNGKVIVTTDTRLVIYDPGESGEAGQVMEQPIAEAQLPNALAFLMGTGRLEEDFSFKLLDPKREGYPSGQVLELRALEPTPHYERILFYVESAPQVRGLVRRLLIIDSSGNRNRFDFSALKFNRGVPDTFFNWKPPAGTRQVNM